MDTVSVLIKPASSSCNLRCRYCFYEDITTLREIPNMGFMSEQTLEQLVQQAMSLAERRVSFAFQGGEPMLRGLEFYQKLIALERKYIRAGLLVEHSIQTNGMLIDEEWADFFRDNGFLVGISMDGMRQLHDANRIDPKGKGTWTIVERAVRLLQKKQVNFNLLCVITGPAGRRGQAIYQNLKNMGCRYLQFIPCLDPLEEEHGSHGFSLSPERYGTFLKTVFDLWYRDWEQGDYVSVRLFDDYVHLLSGQPAGTCATNGACGRYFVVEGDGSVYPCDFFVLDDYRLGSLQEQSLEEMAASPIACSFCTTGRGAPKECEGCRWLPLCGGGCQRDWVDGQRNYHCQAFRDFFEYAYPRLEHIARLERRAARNDNGGGHSR